MRKRFFARNRKVGKRGKISPSDLPLQKAPTNIRDRKVGKREKISPGKFHLQKLSANIAGCKKAEEALQESELRYRTTLDSMADAIHVIDRNLRIVLINKTFLAWCRQLGLTTDIVGLTIYEVFPFLPEKVSKEYRQVFTTGEVLDTEETTKFGEQDIITNTRKIPVMEGSEVTRVVTVIQDITLRKRAEEALQRAQKIESLGILAGGIAHDFNNLLGGIFGFVELALGESQDTEVSRYLTRALQAFNRAKSLTQQLLTFSKGGTPVRKTGSLSPVLKGRVLFILNGSNISPVFEIQEDLWLSDFDEHQICQVIDNMVINAQQAMPMGGRIEVSAKNVTIETGGMIPLPEGNYVKIAIKDCGIGIPREILPCIFDPFFTTKQKGSGLGLAIAYSIIKKHDGYIDVVSTPGQGSTFHIYLPASSANILPASIQPIMLTKGNGHILMMDDELLIRQIVERMLKSLGYTVVCARDGREAIDLFGKAIQDQHPFDAVILDLTVPGGIGGKEAIVGMHQLCSDIIAVASSGYADDPIMASPSKYGFTASIAKPYMKNDLAELLHRVLPPQKG